MKENKKQKKKKRRREEKVKGKGKGKKKEKGRKGKGQRQDLKARKGTLRDKNKPKKIYLTINSYLYRYVTLFVYIETHSFSKAVLQARWGFV